jgi:two-component system CheB/CheR fusion protein
MSDRLTVLLVDDDPNIRSLFQMVLDHHGLDLVATADQPTALEYLSDQTPNIIVIDIFLPTSDGYKMLQAIRNLPHLQQCPVVATTAYYTTDTVTDIEQSGFDGYLLKPLDPQQLVAYLKQVLDLV